MADQTRVEEQRRCDRCKHHRDYYANGRLVCLVIGRTYPVSQMRAPGSVCGPDGRLFEKERK